MPEEALQCRIHGSTNSPVLIYLPGLHGDWTLTGPFRAALGDRARLVVFSYPRRTDWNLDQYARAILAVLGEQGIRRGWILAESFSSQVAWAIIQTLGDPGSIGGSHSFELEGVVFVGGFVRHPTQLGVRLAHLTSRALPMRIVRRVFAAYGHWAKRRALGDDAIAGEIEEFVTRRSSEPDRAAITSRYVLIRDNDFRPIARTCRWPVYFLTGAIDPIVPWPWVLPWVRRQCPGYRGHRVIWGAGHNVLLDAPEECARQILDWTR